MNPVDEEIEKIRAVRRKICDQFGNDPKRMLEYYRKVEQELRAQGYKFVGDKAESEMLLREEPPPESK